MHTEILKTYSKEQITAEMRRLEEKYESLEMMHQKMQVRKCSDPEQVDDYMVWRTLKENEDVRLTERIVYKNLDIYQMISPKRMELLDYLTTHTTKSIKTLAHELKRNYKNVYDDIRAMEKFELVELVDDGRNKRPVTKIESIIMMPDRKVGP